MSEIRKVTLSVPTEYLNALEAFNKATGITLLTIEGTKKPRAINSWEDLCKLIGSKVKYPLRYPSVFKKSTESEIAVSLIAQLIAVSPDATADFLISLVILENQCTEDDAWKIIKDKFLSLVNDCKSTKKQENP